MFGDYFYYYGSKLSIFYEESVIIPQIGPNVVRALPLASGRRYVVTTVVFRTYDNSYQPPLQPSSSSLGPDLATPTSFFCHINPLRDTMEKI